MARDQSTQEKVEYQAEKAKAQLTDFIRDLYHLFIRANKPDRKSYISAARIVLLGVLVMGIVGFVVKIASIPINNILIGGTGK